MDANENVCEVSKDEKKQKKERVWTVLFGIGLLLMIACLTVIRTHASTLPGDISKAAGSIYKDIKLIATPIAAVSFVLALLISFLSHNQKAVDASRQTAKGILITWLVIMIGGAIFTYGKDIVNDISGAGDIPTFESTTTTDSDDKTNDSDDTTN